MTVIDSHEVTRALPSRCTSSENGSKISRLGAKKVDGIKHGGWLPYLEKLGIDERNARSWVDEYEQLGKSEPNNPGSDSAKSSTRGRNVQGKNQGDDHNLDSRRKTSPLARCRWGVRCWVYR